MSTKFCSWAFPLWAYYHLNWTSKCPTLTRINFSKFSSKDLAYAGLKFQLSKQNYGHPLEPTNNKKLSTIGFTRGLITGNLKEKVRTGREGEKTSLIQMKGWALVFYSSVGAAFHSIVYLMRRWKRGTWSLCLPKATRRGQHQFTITYFLKISTCTHCINMCKHSAF